MPGGTQLQRVQQVPHALKHILCLDARLHLASHAVPHSEKNYEDGFRILSFRWIKKIIKF